MHTCPARLTYVKDKIDTIRNWQQEILPHTGTLELFYMLMS